MKRRLFFGVVVVLVLLPWLASAEFMSIKAHNIASDNGALSGVDNAAVNRLNAAQEITGGQITGTLKVTAKADNVTLTAQEVSGSLVECGAGCVTLTLPPVATGYSVCVMATDNTQKYVDPNASDAIVYSDGTDFGNGSRAASPAGPIGQFICLYGSATAHKWRVTGRGADAWTDGN